MTAETLKKVQMQLFDILCEVDRVCKENDIKYWLDGGTCLGAVRHKGFIPWDDDIDIGMDRDDYERFRIIANKQLGNQYCFQDWMTNDSYPLPYGKVRKKGTKYIEDRSNLNEENGFFLDVFPYDTLPDDFRARKKLIRRLANIERVLLMQCGFRPWIVGGRKSIAKRIVYIPYVLHSFLTKRSNLISSYEELIRSVKKGIYYYEQVGVSTIYKCKKTAFKEITNLTFEGKTFPVPRDYDEYLSSLYGNYMELPPVSERENRHQIIEIDFGEEADV